jgi:hypothetical protein
MADHFSLEGMSGVGSQSGERRRGGMSITGRGSSSVGQPKGEPTALGRPATASMSLVVGDRGVVGLVGQAAWEASWPEREWATW